MNQSPSNPNHPSPDTDKHAKTAAKEIFGHPAGLYVCFTTELWERFSFYGMRYLLLLYLTKYHLFSDSAGYEILGAYAGLVYTLPLIGGFLADRYLGMRKAVIFGALMLTAGHALMAVEGQQARRYEAGTQLTETLTLNNGQLLAAGTRLSEDLVVQDVLALNIFFLALALITVGVGFLKPNISTIVGRLYAENDSRRDSGFTIFYMGINLGALIAVLFCGWLGESFGWSYGFAAAGLGMLFGLLTFLSGQKYLQACADPSHPERLKEAAFAWSNVPWLTGWLNKERAIYLGSLLALGLLWWLIQNENVVHLAQNSLLMVAVVGLILYAMLSQEGATDQSLKHDARAWGLAVLSVAGGLLWVFSGSDIGLAAMLLCLLAFIVYGYFTHDSMEFSRTVVLMVLIVSSIAFWSLLEQSAGSMTLYADRVVDREVLGFTLRASWFGSLNPFFIIVLAIPFASLWVWLAKTNREPSTPVKFGLGVIQVGLGFAALVLGANFADESGKIAAFWLVLAYLLHTTGELCVSPVGLSAVTKLSIGRVVGVSMGTWFLATALSETVAMRIAKMADVTPESDVLANSLGMLAAYTDLYEFLTWLGVAVGLFILLISPWLKKGMRGIH